MLGLLVLEEVIDDGPVRRESLSLSVELSQELSLDQETLKLDITVVVVARGGQDTVAIVTVRGRVIDAMS